MDLLGLEVPMDLIRLNCFLSPFCYIYLSIDPSIYPLSLSLALSPLNFICSVVYHTIYPVSELLICLSFRRSEHESARMELSSSYPNLRIASWVGERLGDWVIGCLSC